VIIAIILLVGAAVAFFVVLVTFNPAASGIDGTSVAVTRYTQITDRLLAMGDPSRAEALLERHACTACHLMGGERVAPGWANIAELAPQRRPPLSAAEYIYEAIVHPAVHLVEGYPASMPQDYGTRLSEQELADMLVYLLTPPAN
jgi:cytochrome c551/c552